jgi:uncharacterized protein (TIGR02217 family)
MAYINIRLSECVAYGFRGGPAWNTQIVYLANGREQRNGQWLYPQHRYSAQYMNLDDAAKPEVLGAFHACRGRLHCFRFKDWNDYRHNDGDGSPVFVQVAGVWRMAKQYTLGSETSTRLIQAPVSGAISLSGGSLSNLDFETGIYDGDATGLTWTGEFDVWVRFDSDYNAFTIGSPNAHTADIELVEVRR